MDSEEVETSIHSRFYFGCNHNKMFEESSGERTCSLNMEPISYVETLMDVDHSTSSCSTKLVYSPQEGETAIAELESPADPSDRKILHVLWS